MFHLGRAGVAAALACSAALASAEELPAAAMGEALLQPAPYAATVVIVPSSGAAPYGQLADALHERGFGSLVLDEDHRRSGKAVAAAVAEAKAATASPCIWLLGHGEGSRRALAAAQTASDLCGVIVISADGRAKSARLAARLSVPLMILSGGKDLQAGPKAGAALRAAQPNARHAVVLEMDHVLRATSVETASTAAISPKAIEVIGQFMLDKGPQVHGSLEPKERGSRGSRRAALVMRAAAARS